MSVLFVLTSHDVLGNTGRKTGLWLEEFLVPYYRTIDAGHKVVLATPKGGQAPVDPASIEAFKDSELYARYAGDRALTAAMIQTIKIANVDKNATEAAIYPGGHGPLWDLRNDKDSINLIADLLKQNKPVATICHAGCALLEVKNEDGTNLVSGRNVTSFSDSEEAAVDMVEHCPYLVETELKKLGAKYTKGGDWANHSVQDGLLITGQNPASSSAVADMVLTQIKSA